MTIADLRRCYQNGEARPVDVLRDIFRRIRAEGERPIWISLADEARALDASAPVDLSLPLGGVPFAVKDSIDIAGMPTTVACPAFSYAAGGDGAGRPAAARCRRDSRRQDEPRSVRHGARRRALARTAPASTCSIPDTSLADPARDRRSRRATGLCAFALGTDTAGSGRVPAAFNNLVGVKPTRGLLSTTGLVPACRSLDCISILATTAADGELVWRLAQGPDASEPVFAHVAPGAGAAPWLPGPFRFGVPHRSQLEFFGDQAAALLFAQAIERLEASGGIRVTIDFTPFREASGLLYAGTWVAERFAALGDFIVAQCRRGQSDRGIHHPWRQPSIAPQMPTSAATA